MSIESEADFRGLRAVGLVVAETLSRVKSRVRVGISTQELDHIALNVFQNYGARSGPQLDYGYPGSICISVNEEAVHGIPGSRVLRSGDLVTLDVTAELNGYYADAAVTIALSPVTALARRLKACAEAAFWKALKHAKHGLPLRKLGQVIENEVHRRGFQVLRDLSGHGVGRKIHEQPTVPNFPDPEAHGCLREGMVVTVEPIISVSSNMTRTLSDGWTVVSDDGSLTAHYEHTILVGRNRPYLLTAT